MKKTLRFAGLFVALFALFALVACAPSSVDKAKEKMEKAGYNCAALTGDEVDEDGYVGGFVASEKGNNILGSIGSALEGKVMFAALYDSASHAKAAAKDDDGNIPDGVEVIGKWDVSGDRDAIKAFKK